MRAALSQRLISASSRSHTGPVFQLFISQVGLQRSYDAPLISQKSWQKPSSPSCRPLLGMGIMPSSAPGGTHVCYKCGVNCCKSGVNWGAKVLARTQMRTISISLLGYFKEKENHISMFRLEANVIQIRFLLQSDFKGWLSTLFL